MSKYQSYSCYKLLELFDSWYEHDTDRLNYAQYLLTMQNAQSIKDMIEIYNKVLWKFILRYNGIGKEDLVSETWYDINTLSIDTREYWRSLDVFLNENILRLFNSQDYTDELAVECFINLRETSNYYSSRQSIISKSTAEASSTMDKLESSLSIVTDAPNHISPYNLETNGYREYKPKYIDSIKEILRHGYIKSIKDSAFELKNKIYYFQDNKSVVKFVAIMAIILIIVCLALSKIDFITIILLIGIPGALISFLRK